eukprot:1161659-Pelagomonas_calceolata.AAC.12
MECCQYNILSFFLFRAMCLQSRPSTRTIECHENCATQHCASSALTSGMLLNRQNRSAGGAPKEPERTASCSTPKRPSFKKAHHHSTR